MTTVTDSDLREIKDLINGLDKKIDVNQARTDEKLNAIEKRLELVKTRISAQTNWFIGAFAALVGGLLAFLGKFILFPNP
jgi:acetolactate synthase small subunit